MVLKEISKVSHIRFTVMDVNLIMISQIKIAKVSNEIYRYYKVGNFKTSVIGKFIGMLL